MTSCEGTDPIDNGNNTEQGGNENGGGQETPEPEAPATITLENVTYNSVTFTGHLNVAASDLSFSQVTVYYSDAETFNMNAAQSVSATSFDKDQNFTITLTNLKYNTKYNYCMVAEVKSEKTYGDVLEFTTLPHPYDVVSNLNMSSATDLSSSGSANCYIVSNAGLYKFKTVKGNSSESVGNVASASILWETFGTSATPECLDLIKAVDYENGYIAFQTADTFKEGNAVIAAKDASDNILWSWHIWFTDQPEEHVYPNDAGTMMDRNIGATSATPGDVGALGLLYQWGHKDPFLGSSSITDAIEAKSTITWPSPISSNSSNGTIEYSTSYPTTFVFMRGGNHDWYYTGDDTIDNTRWTTSETKKSIYDPCPAGWRVPDGGYKGVWEKANFDYTPHDRTNKGLLLSISSTTTTWYPCSGWRDYYDGDLVRVGQDFYYWFASPGLYGADDWGGGLYINYDGTVSPSTSIYCSNCYSVRCIKE